MRQFKASAGLAILIQLIVVILAGCSPGGLFSGKMLDYPTRSIPVTATAAQEALTLLSEPQPDNIVRLTESQFSSLLNRQIQPQTADLQPMINVWFEPESIYLQATMPKGTVPVQVTLERAGVGIFPAIPASALDFLNEQIEEMLHDVSPQQMPLDIVVEEGILTIHLRSGDER
jgi:hypothetical protein